MMGDKTWWNAERSGIPPLFYICRCRTAWRLPVGALAVPAQADPPIRSSMTAAFRESLGEPQGTFPQVLKISDIFSI